MNIQKAGFEDLFVIEPEVFEDERGFFMESYNQKNFQEYGLSFNFIQDNHSKSKKGVLRGLHFQNPPFAQTKLIRVIRGLVQEVVVDLRKQSETFGKYFSIELSSENKKQLLIPKGFANGFMVLSDEAEILYKCDELYHPESEGGIIYNDPEININWILDDNYPIQSEKDRGLPQLKDVEINF